MLPAAKTELEASQEKEAMGAEQIAERAKEIAEHIMDRQDDVAQEEHWRTHMQRQLGKLEAQNTGMEAQIGELRKQIEKLVPIEQRRI